jgi:hypothetical protein
MLERESLTFDDGKIFELGSSDPSLDLLLLGLLDRVVFVHRDQPDYLLSIEEPCTSEGVVDSMHEAIVGDARSALLKKVTRFLSQQGCVIVVLKRTIQISSNESILVLLEGVDVLLLHFAVVSTDQHVVVLEVDWDLEPETFQPGLVHDVADDLVLANFVEEDEALRNDQRNDLLHRRQVETDDDVGPLLGLVDVNPHQCLVDDIDLLFLRVEVLGTVFLAPDAFGVLDYLMGGEFLTDIVPSDDVALL